MEKTATWGEFSRKVFEALFVWLLISLGVGFAASALLGDVSLYFFVQYVVPGCLLGLVIQVAFLWRRRPNG